MTWDKRGWWALVMKLLFALTMSFEILPIPHFTDEKAKPELTNGRQKLTRRQNSAQLNCQ